MIDAALRQPKEQLMRPLVVRLEHTHPSSLTLTGFVVGLLAIAAAAAGFTYSALALWLTNRLLDGLDGELARHFGNQTDWGGYLDILADFVIYAGLPIALVYAQTSHTQASEGLWLLLSLMLALFYVNAASWMFLAAILEKRGAVAGRTSVQMPAGLIEGAETLVFFCLFLLFSGWLAWLFGLMSLLLLVTIGQRLWWASQHLRDAT